MKKAISVKAAVKPLSATTATRAAKKIDMGAALNYGKASDLGINSPTHRNTHNEDLFGDAPAPSKAAKSSNDIIEDIFSSAGPGDDFDPRAEEATADFGDFASAFGASQAAAVPAPVVTGFADFSAAFSPPQSAAPPPVDNFLFNPAPTPPTSSLLGSADLFGNSVITNAFTSPAGGTGKDLLSDFGDLSLNPIQGKNFAT